MSDSGTVTAVDSSLVALVAELQAYVRATDHLYKTAFKFGVRTHPIPFFGNLTRARVITIGLNPSATEFERHDWPPDLDAASLTKRLLLYFDSDAHPWFDAWEKALATFGASYGSNAAHVDVTPRATLNAGSLDADAVERLASDDLPWMLRFVQAASRARLVLVAGTLNRRFYLNEFLRDKMPHHGGSLGGACRRPRGEKGFLLRHSLTIGDHTLPALFCSSGPSDRRNPGLLARKIASESELLRAEIE